MKFLIYRINSCDDCPESRFERGFDVECCECGLQPSSFSHEDPYDYCFLQDDCDIRNNIVRILNENKDMETEELADLLMSEVLDNNVCTSWGI